jgi:hypothetical protein
MGREAFDVEDIWIESSGTLTWKRGTCAMVREDPPKDHVFTWIGWCRAIIGEAFPSCEVMGEEHFPYVIEGFVVSTHM